MGPSHRRLRLFLYRLLRALGLCRPVALVVDEYEDIALCLGYMLHHMGGFSVYHAFDGLSAVQKALALEPDLIILDGRMPELNGVQVLRLLKGTRAGRRAKFILESAWQGFEQPALGAGADAFFLKPCTGSALADTAKRLVGRS